MGHSSPGSLFFSRMQGMKRTSRHTGHVDRVNDVSIRVHLIDYVPRLQSDGLVSGGHTVYNPVD